MSLCVKAGVAIFCFTMQIQTKNNRLLSFEWAVHTLLSQMRFDSADAEGAL